MKRQQQVRRESSNPVFGANRMKLGIFGANCSGGCTSTTIPGTLEAHWPDILELAQVADEAGFEAMVPIARWRGFGGVTNFNGENFETYTWAAGLAASTRRIGVFSTSHVPTIHPIVAAKQSTTIDHISAGRFALNVVCGWFTPEFEMFGAPIMAHDERYAYASEWLDVVRRLWASEEEFDFEGRYFKINKGFHQPKPRQQPLPPIMSAGGSQVGQLFAAKEADLAFITPRQRDEESTRQQVQQLKKLAWEEFGRTLQVWTYGYVVCRPTEREAREYLDYYVREKGDWEAAGNIIYHATRQAGFVDPATIEQFKYHAVAGWGGLPLVGTAEQIVEELGWLSRAGVDGCLLSWPSYSEGLAQWNREVMPLLEQAGLRQPPRAGDV